MADVIHANYLSLSVIRRFEIQLGFGDKSVSEVCTMHQVNVDFFLAIINVFNNKEYFAREHLQSFSLELLVDYLLKSHRHYLDDKLPRISQLINQLEWDSNEGKKNKVLLQNFFEEYKNEVITHIAYEDDTVYPYALWISDLSTHNLITDADFKRMQSYNIQLYEDEHNNIEEKLLDLKNIIIKYMLAPKNTETAHQVLTEIFKLESDLQEHSIIEEKVLIPKVNLIENNLRKAL